MRKLLAKMPFVICGNSIKKKIVNTEEYNTIDEHLDYYDGWARQIAKWRIAQILHSLDGKIEPDCRAYITEKRFDELDRSHRL